MKKKTYGKHKQELFKKLQHLGICFIIMVCALVIANAWSNIATGAGLIPGVYDSDGDGSTADELSDDGIDGNGKAIPGATAGNGIDDSTEQLNGFIVGILNWILGSAGVLFAAGLVLIAVMHYRENDPDKRA